MTSINKVFGIAASGMLAQQANLDIIANNVANANTVGFKRSRAEFADVVYDRATLGPEAQPTDQYTPPSILPVAGVEVVAASRVSSPGLLVPSRRHLDLAIEGEGFFQVRLPDGTTGYTRDGALSLDANGHLVNSSGLALLPELRIEVPAEQIEISGDGRVLAREGEEVAEVGQITLAKFANPMGLLAIGHNLFRETAASGAPITGQPGSQNLGSLRPQTLELSNVDIAEEMVNMVTAQRAYQLSSRALQVADEMLGMANSLRG